MMKISQLTDRQADRLTERACRKRLNNLQQAWNDHMTPAELAKGTVDDGAWNVQDEFYEPFSPSGPCKVSKLESHNQQAEPNFSRGSKVDRYFVSVLDNQSWVNISVHGSELGRIILSR